MMYSLPPGSRRSTRSERKRLAIMSGVKPSCARARPELPGDTSDTVYLDTCTAAIQQKGTHTPGYSRI
eukprot:6994482-Prymnesium_polylepis.1